MKTLLIVAHSLTGGTRRMAEAAARGAARAMHGDTAASGEPAAIGEPAAQGVRVLSREAPDASAADVLAADGYLFAAPETLASMSGLMKDFFDRTYYPALDRIAGRPYAIMICAGSDGSGAARQITRIATGWRLRPVAPPLIVRTAAQTPEAILARKTITPDDLARCADLGETLAAGLAMGVF